MLQHDHLSSEAGDDVTPEKIVQDLKSEDLATQMRAVRAARSILCEEDPPITAMVQAGIIAPLVDALDRCDCPNFQYRALGVLTNVAFGSPEYTIDVIKSGCIPKLMTLLVHEGDLAERTILTLGNFALHGPEARNAVLAHGAVPAMLPYMHKKTPIKQLRTFVRTYSNLCSNNDDKTEIELVSPALPYVCELLDMKDEEPLEIEDGNPLDIAASATQQNLIQKTRTASDIVEAACTALANIMLGPDECIEAVQAVPGLTARLVALLGHEAANVQGAALSAVGNMLAGTDEQVDRCLDANCLDQIVFLLQCSNTSLMQEAVRATGNILAGTHSQIQRVLEKDTLTLIQNILGDEDPECQKQAVHAVTSLCMQGSAEQLAHGISRGVLEPYCALLSASDRAVAGEVLDGLHALTKVAERDGNVKLLCYLLDELEVLDKLEQLQQHVADEDHSCKLVNMSVTLRKHAREERSVACDEMVFTSEKIVQELNSQHQATQTRATRALYCILHEQNPPINALLEAGILAPLVQWLDRDACSDLLNVAAWALCIITAGTRKHTKDVADCGAIPKLIALLVHGEKVSELAVSSLGSIALHEHETRDAVLAYTRSKTGLTELYTFIRAYYDLCSQIRHESLMTLEYILRALPFVSELLYIDDLEILKETCRAFAYLLSDTNNHAIEVMQAVPGLLVRLMGLLGHEDVDVKELVFITVLNMLSGTSAQIDRCLDAGCLDHVKSLLQCSEPTLVKVAAEVTSSIFRGSHSQIQRALDKGILTPLMIVLTKGDTRYQKQAVIAITNLCENGSAEQHAHILSRGVLEPYCALLTSSDLAVTERVLDGLFILLQAAKKDDKAKPLCMKLDEIGVLDHLQKLQEREIDKNLYQKAVVVSVTLREQARDEHLVILYGKVYTPADIVQDLKSQDLATQMRAAFAAGNMLEEQDPPITTLVQAGVVPPLVAALGRDDCFNLQLNATFALEVIVDGTHTHRVAVVNAGAIPKLVGLLSCGEQLAGQAAKILGRITHRAPVTRHLVLSHEAVQAMLPHMRPDTSPELLRICVWAYWYWCRIPPVSMSTLSFLLTALPCLFKLLNMEDQHVLKFACGAFGSMMKGPEDYVEAVQAVPGLTARLVALLGHEDTGVKYMALGALTNMLSGNHVQAARCIEAGCVSHVVLHLRDKEPAIVGNAVEATNNMLRHIHSETQRVLEKDILTPLMDILAYAEPNSFLQYNAVCALTNMAEHGTRDNRMALVDAGAIPKLIAFLSHGAAVAEKAAWVLGAIVRDVPETRKLLITNGAVPAMVQLMRPDTPLTLLRRTMWAFCFLWDDDTEPAEVLKHVSPALPQLSELLSSGDEIVLEFAGWAIIDVTKNNEGIEAVQAVPGLTARLVALLGHEAARVKNVAITAVMAMLSGADNQVDRCLEANCIEHMISYLECRDPALIEEAGETTRDVLGATHPRLQRALDKDILTTFMNILACPPKGQRRTVKGITNLCRRAPAEQSARVVSRGVLEPYCALLAASDRAVAGEALHSLDVLLQVAVNDENLNSFSLKLVEMGVLDQMKQLQEHEDTEVKEKACRLLNTYFPEE